MKQQLLSDPAAGLTSAQAREQLLKFGPNVLGRHRRLAPIAIFLSQFKSAIVLILIAAALVSFVVQSETDAVLILLVVLVSGLLGFVQENSASHAIEKLRSMVETKVSVWRDAREISIPLAEVVPQDVVILSAGSIIPGDGHVIESRELFVNESILTGESFPAEKSSGASSEKNSALFLGTHVVSGWGKASISATGAATRFGKIAAGLRLRRPETEFEHGVRRFGYLLAEITFVLVLAIFAINVFLQKPVLDSFLFAVALAVGLTPQLLPAIITINLSHGARRMAEKKVIVKRLAAIENFGSMNVLCCDKTGTITEGKIDIRETIDPRGAPCSKTGFFAYLNALNETGFVNPIDQAIRAQPVVDCSAWKKIDELPYDFARKRLSVLLEKDGHRFLVTKGAAREIMEASSEVEWADGNRAKIDIAREEAEEQWRKFSAMGCRVLGVAYREFDASVSQIGREDETDLIFLGFVVLADQPKAGIEQTLQALSGLGVRVKIITGDNRLVAKHLSEKVGLDRARLLTGPEIEEMSNSALIRQAVEVDIFAEIEPSQKERLILALKKSGQVVGYIGDGVNDVSALHAADVGLSVEGAVDVAREAADFVLLDRDLEVLIDGIREGRRTFANTLKYVFIATSANFGNMFSMAGTSLFLSFLPLLPKQILFLNLLTDLPEMTIAADNVDAELTDRPHRWDIRFIRRFMMVFGLISSAFDFLTFGILFWLKANVAQFRTGWFIESIVSASLIVLVVRTRHSALRSRPSRLLVSATFGVIIVAVVIPHLPIAHAFGFAAMPAHFYPIIALIIFGYVVTAETAKRFFYRKSAGNAQS